METIFVRQGDVGALYVDPLPPEARDITPEGGIVLAYGEVTGHSHVLEANPLVRLMEWQNRQYVVIPEGVEVPLRHEEHNTVTLTPGTIKVIHQREYSPSELRRVLD